MVLASLQASAPLVQPQPATWWLLAKYYRKLRRFGLPLGLVQAFARSRAWKKQQDRRHAAEMQTFRTEVVSRGDFTVDWFSRNITHLVPLLAELKPCGSRVLEIGSHEGLSTAFFFRFLAPQAITCVDPHQEYDEMRERGYSMAGVAERFQQNIAAFADPARVRLLKLPSYAGLTRLLQEGEGDSYDLAYVDGSHHPHDVMLDSILAWRLLRPDGIMIHDDYLWKEMQNRQQEPMIAVNAFLELTGHYELLYLGYQIALRKLTPG